jgi:hypothetical protein
LSGNRNFRPTFSKAGKNRGAACGRFGSLQVFTAAVDLCMANGYLVGNF